MRSDKEKIEEIKRMISENQDMKFTTSVLALNCIDVKDENEVRDLVEKSDLLFRDGDVIKLKNN